MKSIVAVCVILVLVAVNGSQAQPVAGATSPGFDNCQPNGPRALDRSLCQPLAATEVGDNPDPEVLLGVLVIVARAAVVAAVGWAVTRALDWYFGDDVVQPEDLTHVDQTIFDPSH